MADEIEERIKAKAAEIVAAVPEGEEGEAMDVHLRVAALLFRRTLLGMEVSDDALEAIHDGLDTALDQTKDA